MLNIIPIVRTWYVSRQILHDGHLLHLAPRNLDLMVIPLGEIKLSLSPGYGFTIFPAEVLLVPRADQFRRNFGDDSFSLFFGR